uniref:Tigger transposable element-derived protein 4 n=1 Tax=Lygus hesperus TaxID=30085 RepID=A0A0A9VYT7_LYGHE
MANVKRRRDLSLSDKRDVLVKFDALPKMSQTKAAIELGVSQPLLSKILKDRETIERAALENADLARKRKRTGKDAQVENALKEWFTQVREKDARLSGPIMREKAEQLAQKLGKEDFKATTGWFVRWRKRENIVHRKPHKSTVHKSTVSLTVFNADETALYYRANFLNDE